MKLPRFDDIQVGYELPAFTAEPIGRVTLALYAGASGDHNPIHIDSDFAKRAGMPDVFAQGMLAMAYLGHVLTSWAPQAALRSYGVRFQAITHLGDSLVCSGKVVEKHADGERQVRVHVTATDLEGEIKLAGEAVIALA
jgi:acyl dehydratase